MTSTQSENLTSLYLGKFSPFSSTHSATIRQLINEGRKVVVAVRTGDVQTASPHGFPIVMKQVTDLFPHTQVIMLPPFDEIVHGQEPGWSVREIKVIEPITATALRSAAIIWIIGQSGSGKTSLASQLKKMFLPDAVILDGPEMRETISSEEGYGEEDQHKHNLRVAQLASLLQSQGHMVIVSVSTPYVATRLLIGDRIAPIWFYLPGASAEALNNKWPYEMPESFEPITTLHVENARPAEVAEEAWDWIARELGA